MHVKCHSPEIHRVEALKKKKRRNLEAELRNSVPTLRYND